MRYYQQVARTTGSPDELDRFQSRRLDIVIDWHRSSTYLPSFHLHRQYPLFVWARSPVSVR